MIAQEELDKIFKYTAPTQEHRNKFEKLNDAMMVYVNAVNELCPDSREKSLAITHIDTARFFANGAIVRRDNYIEAKELVNKQNAIPPAENDK